MHEYSIAAALIERAEAEAEKHGARAVLRVSVRLGELSGVEPELLSTAFELARESTRCAAASLEVDYVKARWACASCEEVVDPKIAIRCASCGGAARLVGGEELDLCSLELEVNDV
jgi:hydrogenase nickel incorporation protein HypA/HybF